MKPVGRGPLDLKMGVGNKAGTCETCGHKLEKCVGHFGHMRLCLPVFHIGFFKHMLNVLKCVCKRCGKVMMPEADKASALAKLKAVKLNYTARALHMKKLLK
jgi:DNA-directed RNA polymerase III subunit RPC1